MGNFSKLTDQQLTAMATAKSPNALTQQLSELADKTLQTKYQTLSLRKRANRRSRLLTAWVHTIERGALPLDIFMLLFDCFSITGISIIIFASISLAALLVMSIAFTILIYLKRAGQAQSLQDKYRFNLFKFKASRAMQARASPGTSAMQARASSAVGDDILVHVSGLNKSLAFKASLRGLFGAGTLLFTHYTFVYTILPGMMVGGVLLASPPALLVAAMVMVLFSAVIASIDYQSRQSVNRQRQQVKNLVQQIDAHLCVWDNSDSSRNDFSITTTDGPIQHSHSPYEAQRHTGS
jgi:hypothetical protein